jgi:dTMP kinase
LKSGLFITFEGSDGSGKTTQIHLLAEHCRKSGHQVLLTREPGGTPIAENIRAVILDPKNKELAPTTEALLYAASRAQHVAEVIRPALKEGKLVFCDRFMDSSIAYQGYGRELGDDVRIINEFAVQGLSPDLTFFLDMKPSQGLDRIEKNGNLDRIEKEQLAFHEKVYNGYLILRELNAHRYVTIDAAAPAEVVAEQIKNIFDRWLHQVDCR